ncbi:MAG: hypothetical protein HW421_612 [Ignavibacteria bacterium]|nr:hypothetical protein [Ignavibacteria bacterium]
MRKNCLIAAVGMESLHREWLSPVRNYDVILVTYKPEAFEKFRNDGELCIFKHGFKYNLIMHLFLMGHVNIENYDFYYFPDDDLEISAKAINELFRIAGEYQLEICQPSLYPVNISHEITVNRHNSLLRFTNYVEIMNPCFSQKALKECLPYFNESQSGWGFEFLWFKLLNNPINKFAIIDAIIAKHTRVPNSPENELYKNLSNNPKSEMESLIRKYRLIDEKKEFSSIVLNEELNEIDTELLSSVIFSGSVNSTAHSEDAAFLDSIENNEDAAFWYNFLKSEGSGNKQDFLDRLNPDLQLQQLYSIILDEAGSTSPKILVLNAGPVTNIGKIYKGNKIDITATDKIPNIYEKILAKLNIIPPVKTTYCETEQLCNTFSEETFDIISASYSLDRSTHPKNVIFDLLKLLKSGGSIVLEHIVNSGKKHSYKDDHKWNFAIDNGNFVITGFNDLLCDITQEFRDFVDVKCSGIGNDSFIAILTKKANKEIIDKKPLVSVIIPCYNQSEFLIECVESVIKQTFDDWECIIVNDDSPDNTVEVAKFILSTYPEKNIRLLNKVNGGVSDARNVGIRSASGKYILPLDADDKIALDYLAETVQILESNPDIGYVYVDEKNFGNATHEHSKGVVTLHNLLNANVHDYCSIFRKEVWERVGGYSPAMFLGGSEDWNFWIGAAKLGIKAYHIKKPLFLYRNRENTLVADVLEKLDEVKAHLVFHHFELFDNNIRAMAMDILVNSSAGSRAKLERIVKKIPHNTLLKNFRRLIFGPIFKEELISVIVPTYNRPDLLRLAIQSILLQTYGNIEIIVVNDCGVDCENVIIEFKLPDKIKYFKHQTNKGLAATRNTGLAHARGKYICYLDDDDIYYPTHVFTLVDSLVNSDCKVAYTDAIRAWQRIENQKHLTYKYDVPYSLEFNADELLVGNMFPVLCVMHEKSCTDMLGGFDEALRSHEDWELWIKLSRKFIFQHIKEITCEFSWRTDGSTLSSSARSNMYETMKYIYQKYESDVQHRPDLQTKRDSRMRFEFQDIERQEQIKKEAIVSDDRNIILSIVIPTHNNIDYTRNCIESIEQTCAESSTEIIIVDNASTDGTIDFLRKQDSKPKIQVIFNSSNENYAKANNQGVALAKGCYIIFLNNDTKPFPGWTDELVKVFENDVKVGIQGAKLLYPNDRVQHAGIVFGKVSPQLTMHYHIYLNTPGDAPCVNVPREYQMVTGALLAIRKELFNQIGGFDENYLFGHEDLDLCLSARKLGFKVWYNPKVSAYHFESITKKLRGLEQFESFVRNPNGMDSRNNEYFLEKWQGFLFEDADKYYLEDGFLNLVSDERIINDYIQRVDFIVNKIKFYFNNEQQNRAVRLIQILFQTTDININFSEKGQLERIPGSQLENAERFITDSEEQNQESQQISKPTPADKIVTSTKKMKILFTMYGWNESGGGTTFPKSVAKRLNKKGYDVAVFYAAARNLSETKPYLMEQWEDEGVKLYGVFNRPTVFLDTLNPEREVRDENCTALFANVLDEFMPDIVHYHNFLGLSYAIADEVKKRNIPTIYTPHNYHLIDPTLYFIRSDLSLWDGVDFFANSEIIKAYPELTNAFNTRVETARALLRDKIDLTIAVSKRVKEFLTDFSGSENKIAVVNQIPPTIEFDGSITKKLLPPQLPLKLGFIGAVMPHKGVHLIVQAAQMLHKEDVQFIVYGMTSEEYLKILKLLDRNEMVSFRGEFKNSKLTTIAGELDAMIIPSIWEDCAPLVVAESIALGLPVIAANIGGISDFIIEDFNGKFYKYDSPEAMAAVISELIQNPEHLKTMQDNCRLPYSFDDYIDHVLKIYQKLINREKFSNDDVNLIFKDVLGRSST